MDDETSRASYDNSTSRFSEDFHRSEKFRLETQLHDAQSELYHLRRLMPFLESTNPDDPGVTFRHLASECADLREERDKLLRDIGQIQDSTREELQKKDDLIDGLRRELEENREERDRYKQKCQQYERELSDEESQYYRRELERHRPALRTELPEERFHSDSVDRPHDENDDIDRRQRHNNRRFNFQPSQQIPEDSELNNIYARMNEENSEISSVASHTSHQNSRPELNFNYEANIMINDSQDVSFDVGDHTHAATANLTEYINTLKSYRANVRALYDQMKSTARFFLEILKRFGYEEDPQVQLMMKKIDQIKLNMQDSENLTRKVVKNAKDIGAELAGLCRSFGERGAHSPNGSKQNKSRSSPRELEAMLRQKDDSIAKLRIEKNELDNQCQKLQGDFNEFQHLSAELAKRLEESKNNEHDLAVELANREKIIAVLREQCRQLDVMNVEQLATVKQKLVNLTRDSSYSNAILERKIQEGAPKST